MAEPIEKLSRKELGQLLNLSTRQISNLESEGIPHWVDGRRKWYPAAAVHWYIDRKLEELRDSMKRSTTDESRARKLAAEAKLAEIEVEKAEEALIPLEIHEERLGTLLDRLRAKIRNVPGVWSPRLVGFETVAQATKGLKPLVGEFLETLLEEADELDDEAA